jgi:hypothetical protein
MPYTRARRPSTIHSLLLATASVTLLVSGCGGGGSDGSDVVTPAASQASISGNVVKGPVSGATVSAHGLRNGAAGPALASAMTNAHGAFTLSVGDHSGPVMLRVTGGTYTDEATGSSMSMAASDAMTAVLADVAAGSAVSGVQITPVTSMAQAMAEHLSGGMTAANIMTANSALCAYFLVDDILHTPPMNPLVAGSGTAATQAMMNYGMAMAAMSQYAKNARMPVSSSLVTSMMADASDGTMDGFARGSQIMMGGMMMGGSMMQRNAGTSGLAGAMSDFLGSGMNQSGVVPADMNDLMHKLMSTNGQMH